jgi:C4-dicarboxylate-specific signal transduction histidine kinase
VQERTRDLDAANAQLRQEIEDRIRAEAQLRKTQVIWCRRASWPPWARCRRR